jgi:uncharacterized protein (TIGR00255 family)
VIRSMTGFAAVSREASGQRVSVTIKSVNHRFLDTVTKAPQALSFAEARVRAILQQKLARGRVEVSLSAEFTATPAREVVLDEALLGAITHTLEEARNKGLVSGVLTVSDILRIPQVLEIKTKAGDSAGSGLPEGVEALVDDAVREAVDAMIVMRETEGRFLAADLDARMATLSAFVDEAETIAKAGQAALETKLRDRLASLPIDLTGDANALAQEIVRFVARSDVDEEIVRLRGHLEHWRGLAAGPEPCGRKLDFLVQEMNREINTIGSKIEGPAATERVIAAKAELERVREQVQNVE